MTYLEFKNKIEQILIDKHIVYSEIIIHCMDLSFSKSKIEDIVVEISYLNGVKQLHIYDIYANH